ncbi:hypothetical protein C8J57DRAFT_311112 [Mycena rebaudengoi]|nr:hypothetical protein C8J57DRAFT_311112 [Mycena rebaudengoi]
MRSGGRRRRGRSRRRRARDGRRCWTQREAERKAEEEARRLEREREEEERRIEEERAAEEERIRAEEEAAVAAAEAAKLEAEQKALEQRKQREAERAEAMEKARLQAQREEEAMRRASEKAAPPMRKPIVPAPPSGIRAPVAAPAAANGEGTGVWRRGAGAASGGTPTGSVPVTPTRASGLGSTPPRAESPSPAVAKYTPGALRGAAPGGGGVRRRRGIPLLLGLRRCPRAPRLLRRRPPRRRYRRPR